MSAEKLFGPPHHPRPVGGVPERLPGVAVSWDSPWDGRFGLHHRAALTSAKMLLAAILIAVRANGY